jgi:Replication-relaxation
MKRLTPAALPPSFRLTERDLEMVRFIARNRFASTRQIVRYVAAHPKAEEWGASARGIANRLRLMFDHDIIGRPEHQYYLLRASPALGNPDLVYALGRQGAKLLAEPGDRVNPALDWNKKNADVVPFTLSHEIEVAQTMLDFGLACRASTPSIELLDQDRLFEFLPEETRGSPKPFACKLKVKLSQLKDPLAITIIPDRLFRFRAWNNFALEQDRGTMTIGTERTPLSGRSSFRKKLIGYSNIWNQKLHTKRWGFTRFRVLTITTSESRIRAILEAQRQVANAHGLFLYSTGDRIAEHGILGRCWMSADSDHASLIDVRRE